MKRTNVLNRVFPVLFFSFFIQMYGNAQDCLRDWANRVPVTIDNSAGDALTDYQVRFEIDTETPILLGLMEPDGSDLRVTMSSCCDPLCYYIESGINTATTVIWVNVPVIEAGETIDIYAFFGNPGVEAVSDAECTFAFYEGFDDDDFNFHHLCGTIEDSIVSGGDFDLSWTNSGILGSDITFPYGESYTADVMMNSVSGDWPGIFWSKETSHKSYGLMRWEDMGDAMISLTGDGSSYCSGQNWASSLMPYADTEGLWSLTWIETGSLVAEFPTVGTITSSNALYAKDEDLTLNIGGILYGSGAMNIDWVRVTKYAAIPPTVGVGGLEAFSPASDLVLPDEMIECGSAIMDAGEDFESYDWSSGGDGPTEEVDLSDTYYITVIDSEGCIQNDSIAVFVSAEYEIAVSDIICSGSSYTFPDEFLLEDISEGLVHTSYLSTEGAGCDSIIVTTLELYDFVPLLDLGEDVSSCGDTIFLDAGAGFGSYDWEDGSLGQFDTVLTTGTYSITALDDNGCLQSDEINVSIININNEVSVSELTITSDQVGAIYQWLDCDTEYLEIDGESGMSFEATSNGNYAVEVTIGECVDTSACITISGVSIYENELNGNLFTVYPNPNSGDFNIVLNDFEGEKYIRITSVDGKLVQAMTVNNEQNIPISIQGTNGIYFVEVVYEQSSQITKVIVQ